MGGWLDRFRMLKKLGYKKKEKGKSEIFDVTTTKTKKKETFWPISPAADRDLKKNKNEKY